VRGEVRVLPHTDNPKRFSWLDEVYVDERDPKPIAIEGVRFHKELVLLKLVGYDFRDQTDTLKGEMLLVPMENAIPLEDGEYFLFQLLGLDVYTDEDQHLGVLKDVIETGANNVFVVKGEGKKDILLPDTKEVVTEIDFDNGRLTVHLLPGLLP